MKITKELIEKLKMNKIKITMKKVTTEHFELELDKLKGLDTCEINENLMEILSKQKGESAKHEYFIAQCNNNNDIFGDPLVVFGKPGEFTDNELKDFFKLVNKEPNFILKKYQEHLKSKGKMKQNQKYVPIDPNELKQWIDDQVKLAFYYNYKKPVIVDDPKDLITKDDKAILMFNMNPTKDLEDIYDALGTDDSEDIEEYYLEDEEILPDEEPSNCKEIDEEIPLEDLLEDEGLIISDEEEYVMEEFEPDSPEEEFKPLDDEKYEEKDWIDEE